MKSQQRHKIHTPEKKVCISIPEGIINETVAWLEYEPTYAHEFIQGWLEGQLETAHEILTAIKEEYID